MSPPLPVDELTRLHIQERSKPDFIHESFDPPRYPGPLAVMREREENEMDMLPPETLRGYELDRHERRERPRHRRTAKGEDVYFQEKSQRQRYTRAEYDEGEFELQRKGHQYRDPTWIAMRNLYVYVATRKGRKARA